MLRLENTTGKAFRWDMQPTKEFARRLMRELPLFLRPSLAEFAKAKHEFAHKRLQTLPPAKTVDPKKRKTTQAAMLKESPEHCYRQRDSVRPPRLRIFEWFSDITRNLAGKKAIITGPLPWAGCYSPRKTRAHVMYFNWMKRHSEGLTRVKRQASSLFSQIMCRIQTPEFLLGFSSGLATRVGTKIAILSALASSKDLMLASSFIACAGAGLAAGIITFLVRTKYRNLKAPASAVKEKYWSRQLLESAVIGLLGGLVGGASTSAGGLIARSSTFVIGTAVGISAGLFRAVVKGDWRKEGRVNWEQLAYRSVVFGVIGGALGVVSGDLFGSKVSIAASTPVTGEDSVIYVPPPEPSSLPEVCGTDQCYAPPEPPPPPAQPMATPVIPVVPQEEIIRIRVPAEHHEPPRVPHHPKVPSRERLCYPERPRVAKQVKHLRHLKHAKPPPEPIDIVIRRILMTPVAPGAPAVPMTPAVQVMPSAPVGPVMQGAPMPPVSPMHMYGPGGPQHAPPPAFREMPPIERYNPCEDGECGNEPCYDSSALDIKGPCSDPNTQCVARVSYNDDGEATRAVLEPHAFKTARPYFEITHSPEDLRIANWNNETQGTLIAGNGGRPGELSLVVPVLNNRTLAFAGNMAPRPA
jgi:hypothetical protein